MFDERARKRERRLRIANLLLIGIVIGFTVSAFLFNPFTGSTGDETQPSSAEMLAQAPGIGDTSNRSVVREVPSAAAANQAERGENSLDNALRLEESFNSVVRKVLPSVVELRITERVTQRIPSSQDFFPWFFGIPRDQFEEREFETNSLGSGFIFLKEGDTYYVLTNNHVAGKADRISVVMHDNTIYDNAELIGANVRRDLAVVSFTSEEDYPIVGFGDSDILEVGDWVLAMGSPYGFISSVTAGIVSALGRSGVDIGIVSDFIQTDASINQGNSGGPLVNIRGEVVGINTWIAAPTGGNVGLGFAIPINNVAQVVDQLIEFGDVQDGWLGISMIDTASLPSGYPEVYRKHTGVFVAGVYLNSPSYESGIMPGDIVTKFNTTATRTGEILAREISNANIGVTHSITVIREGEEKTFSVDLDVRQSDEELQRMNAYLWPGVIPIPLTDDVRRELNVASRVEGVMVQYLGTAAGTRLHSAGIRNLDIITSINHNKVTSVEDFYRLMNDEETDEFMIRYIRDRNEFFVGVIR